MTYSALTTRCDIWRQRVEGAWMVIQRRVPNGTVNFTKTGVTMRMDLETWRESSGMD